MAKLPGLFAKLLGNYGDDIVRGVANYGDDVLGAVANYGDDAARAVANYGDDVAGLVADNAGRAVMSPELLSDDFLDAVDDFASVGQTPSSHILGSNPNAIIDRKPSGLALKLMSERGDDALKLSKNYGDDVANFIAKQGNRVTNYNPSRSITQLNDTFKNKGLGLPSVDTTDYIGSVTKDLDWNPTTELYNYSYDKGVSKLGFPTIPVSKHPTDWYVLDDMVGTPGRETVLRPHNNTALGRWFRQQMSKKV